MQELIQTENRRLQRLENKAVTKLLIQNSNPSSPGFSSPAHPLRIVLNQARSELIIASTRRTRISHLIVNDDVICFPISASINRRTDNRLYDLDY